MCDFLDELMQRQGKAGDEEERKRKDDANKDKLVENAEKEGLVTLGPVSLEKRRERDEIEEQWAENAEKEGLVTPGLVSLEKRREREEIEEREAMRKRAHNEAMRLQDREARRLETQEAPRDCFSRGLRVFPWEHLGAENRDETGRWIWPRVQPRPQPPQVQPQLHPQPRLQPQVQPHLQPQQQQEDVKVITDTESGDSLQLIVVGGGL